MMKIAQLFPGQGSQSHQMMSELYQSFEIVQKTFNTATEVLGFDLWDLIQNDADALNQTQNTQVAMLASGYAAHLVLQETTDFSTEFFVGHSLGEYTALVAAGNLSFEEALVLVRKRAELMSQAVPKGEGAMAAILGLEDDKVIDLCQKTAGIVEAVNFNSPGQVVISGETEAVTQASNLAKELGAKRALILPVSVPSHCSLMSEAAQIFKSSVDSVNWSMSDKKVLHNVDMSIAQNIDEIKQKLVAQLHKPVLWTQTIETLIHQDITTMIECGPGKVLAGLNRRISKEINSYPLFNNQTLETIKEI
jgi:[acyl-carrier-protein] S-malonyltransferase